MPVDPVYIALLQINVALGCLYNGLPAARYRTKIYEAVVNAVNSVAAGAAMRDWSVNASPMATPSNYAQVAAILEPAIANNYKLSKSHHLIRRWIAELPQEQQQRICGCDKLNLEDDTSPEELPWLYRWYFGRNHDNVATWMITVFASLFLMWWAISWALRVALGPR